MTASLLIRNWSVKTGDRMLIENASIHFGAGRVWGVVGRSGAGKSVLLKSVLGLMPAHAGEVELHLADNDTIRAQAGKLASFVRLRQHVAFVHQDPALMDDVSVEQNATFAISRLAPKAHAAKRAQVDFWLTRLGLEDLDRHLPSELTPGEQRKVALCRALMLTPRVLVVDEPTTGLDPVASAEIIEALSALAQEGTTLILVSHDIRCLRALAEDLVWVDQGRIKYQGLLPENQSELPQGLVPLLYGATPHFTAPPEV